MVQAKPALVDAIALKPRCCKALAVPTSNGFGITKQAPSCSLRKLARLSAVGSGIALSRVVVVRQKIVMRQLGHNLAQKVPLFRQYEPVLFREIEISDALGIATQSRAIDLIRGKALEGDQGEGDVVGALVRHEIADEVAAAASRCSRGFVAVA